MAMLSSSSMLSTIKHGVERGWSMQLWMVLLFARFVTIWLLLFLSLPYLSDYMTMRELTYTHLSFMGG